MGAGLIQCEVHSTFPIGLIEVTGALRRDTALRLRQVVLKVLTDQPDAIVLDLAGLHEVEDLSVSMFPSLGRTVAATADGELILAAASPVTQAALRRVAPTYVRTFETCDQAMKAAARAPARRRVTRQLPADLHAGRTARRMLDEVCTRWGLDQLREPALMIATELVINAVQHVGPPIELCVTVRHRVLRIEVNDSSGVLPVPLDPASGAGQGYGLWLVDSLASHWGAVPTTWGKTVWADLVMSRGNPGSTMATSSIVVR